MSPQTITHGLSGLGPRNMQLLANLALTILTRRDQLKGWKANNLDFVLQFTVFEKAAEDEVGNAFQQNCDAAVNTGVTGLPAIPGLENVDPAFKKYCNLREAAAEELQANFDAHLEFLKERNPVTAVMLQKATRLDGSVDTSVPCMSRGQWGSIQLKNFNKALAYIADNIPELVITIHYLHEVIDTDFEDSQHPAVIVRKIGETDTSRHSFDFITFAHGTPLVSPFAATPSSKVYSLTPNHDAMRDFLDANGILDEEGYIKHGKSLILTGISLGNYDYATVLLPFLRCFRLTDRNPSGFEIDGNLAAEYKGLLTFVSRNENGPAPPRPMRMEEIPGHRPMLTTEEMHALRLQQKYPWIAPAHQLLEADTARCVGKTPVNLDVSVRELMIRYGTETQAYLRGDEKQETFRLTLLSWALVNGTGFEMDQTAAEKDLVRRAPLSRAGRVGWPMFHASGVEMSRGAMIYTKENETFFEDWYRMHNFAAGAVPLIQLAVSQLFSHGIAEHKIGAFDEIKISETDVSFEDRNFDALLSPKVIERKADILRKHAAGVKEIAEGTPEYGKSMYFKAADGRPINAFDAGLGGWGSKTEIDGKMQTFEKILAATNAHSAAAAWSIDHALEILLMAFALVAKPEKSAIKTIAEWYDAILPEPKAFRQEVEGFRPIWDNLQEKLLFLRFCEQWAGDNADEYRHFTNHAFDAQSRNAFIATRPEDDQQSYASGLEHLLKFDPPTLSQFKRRFSFYTTAQLNSMWDHFAQMAEEVFQAGEEA